MSARVGWVFGLVLVVEDNRISCLVSAKSEHMILQHTDLWLMMQLTILPLFSEVTANDNELLIL